MLQLRTIRCLFILFSVGIGLSVQAEAQTTACPSAPTSDARTLRLLSKTTQPDKGVLWEVSKEGRHSYLYATVHVAKLPWLFPGPLVKKALLESSALAVEVDPTAPSLVQRMNAQQNAVARNADDPEATPARVKALAHRVDVQIERACLAKAKFAGATLGSIATSLELLSARDQGLYPEYAIESGLIGFEKAIGKNVSELETVDEQAVALGSGGISSVEDAVDRLESGEARSQIVKLASTWAAGDFAELERYGDWCNCAKDQKILSFLLDQRNATLANRIDSLYAAQDKVFVAIGVLHMIGPTGLVERLRHMGYLVNQLTEK